MKSIALILIVLAACSFSYGRAKYFAYQNYKVQPDLYRRDYSEGKAFTTNFGKSGTIDLSFPIFSNSSNKYAASKINQMLQISELKILKGFETESLFEKISYDGGGIYGGSTHIKFKVHDNNDRVLSIKFDQSSCGATCTYWVTYYNFNSGNGDSVQLKDLFTEKGYQKFFDFVTKRRTANLRKELVKKVETEQRENYSNIIDCYERSDLEDYFVKNNLLFIDGENCFHKSQKFDGIETVSQFKSSEFEAYLNAYGKTLFGLTNRAVEKYRSNFLPQLFHGKIGNQNVLLVLNNGYEDVVRAEYVYSKYGNGIYLEGKIQGKLLSLVEKLPKPNETGLINYVDNGFIEANFDGRNITGTWTNQDKTKIYNLALSRK